mmetsp:Transcript_104891/g.165569  ORF Transcript_104891/g.165569 Transcript_104891/m.165569 type:complete len:104 (-) Transcript_104891:97-408(-)|eukprot:CAMPEP_0169103372 /NCGR_PEP_ID=MMETSP1015-20121227/22683_1 /TAXON_ID=342587 /ORGANISM="Karlodinium micrum, Strain CCMP2283" /LENGTH=103 /DNA_ID=CAMNT_0009164571 /DNA_START=42 /DNA_END=353 /DNA_ORIENTATION=+
MILASGRSCAWFLIVTIFSILTSSLADLLPVPTPAPPPGKSARLLLSAKHHAANGEDAEKERDADGYEQSASTMEAQPMTRTEAMSLAGTAAGVLALAHGVRR